MRILVVSPYPPARDGIAVHAENLVRALEGEHEVEVLTRRGGPKGPGVHRLLSANPFCLPAAVWMLRRFKPHVVHYQFAIPALGTAALPAFAVGAFAKLFLGSAVVITMHEVRRELSALRSAGVLLFTALVRWAECCIVYTQEGRDLLVSRCGASQDKVRVMPLGVRALTDNSAGDRNHEVLGRYGLEHLTTLLCFGYIHPHKGIEHLLRAVSRLRSESPSILDGVVVLVAGAVRPRRGLFRYFERQDHRYQAMLEKLAAEERLDDIVRFVGFVASADVPALFASAAFVICPYTNSSQSAVLNLAIAAGSPVLASDLPGLRENLPRGGILAEPGEPADLASKMRLLLDNPELRARLRREQFVSRTEMSFDSVAQRLGQLYSEVAGKPGTVESKHA